MRELCRENDGRRSIMEAAAAVTTALWLAFCIWLGFHGHLIMAILFGILLSPVIYLSFAFASVAMDRKNVKDTASGMFEELNSRVGNFTVKDALAFEAAFNQKTPDDMWHDVNVNELGDEIEMHVIHYWHNGSEREWNSELKLYFDKKNEVLKNWLLYMNKGASKLTKYPKVEKQGKYDVFSGPVTNN